MAIDPESVIRAFSPSELRDISQILETEGISIEIDNSEMQTRGIFLNDIFILAIKVSWKTSNPNKNEMYENILGILLVPKKIPIITDLTNFRLIVATPPTDTSNEDATSDLFNRTSLIFDGNQRNPYSKFTPYVANLYTEKSIYNIDIDQNMAYINDILKENSLKPWANKCTFISPRHQ